MDTFKLICKQLTFGVKKKPKKTGNDENLAVNSAVDTLRLRVLPEDFLAENKRVKSEGRVVTESNQEEGVKLLAGSNLTYNPVSKKKKTRLAKERPSEEEVARISAEQIQRLRKLNRIFTWGSDLPNPIVEFSDLNLPAQLKENLSEFKEPTPIQMQAVPIALQNRDLLASAPTGSGKTLAFAIPVILEAFKARQKSDKDSVGLTAIVLSPTKVLAKQTYDQFMKFCANLPINCQLLRETSIETNCNILVATPNKLIYTLDACKDRTDLLRKLKWLVVDESDRIFDKTEGEKSFRPQLEKIIGYCSGKRTKKAFFSATFSYEVEEWCKSNLADVAMVCIGARNSANSSVKQELVFAGWEQAKISAVNDIITKGFEPPALIFVQSKDRAKQLFVELTANFPKISIGLVSGEIPEDECDVVIQKFRDGKVSILICTELLGRGLDFTEVNLVINFDLPTSIVSYIHRIGRTGRAGRSGRAITLFTTSDYDIVRPIATVIQQAGFPVHEYLLKLNKVSKRKKERIRKKAPQRKDLVFEWDRRKRRPLRLNEKVVEKEGSKKVVEKRKKRKRKAKKSDEPAGEGDEQAERQTEGWKTVEPRKKRKRKGSITKEIKI